MLGVSALTAILPTLPTQKFHGVLYRAVALEALYGFHQKPPYTNIDPLYTLGASTSGARYTPKNGMASLYVACDVETAFAEVHQIHSKLRQLNPPVMTPTVPCVLFSAHASIDHVLCLDDPTIQSAIQTNAIELSKPWRLAQNKGSIA